MRPTNVLLALALASALTSLPVLADSPASLITFSGGIGVDPLTAAGGVDVLNTVRGINPGGRAWVIRKLSASVSKDGTITARGKGLLLSSGEVIATRATVAAVALPLFCGPADATARRFTSPSGALDTAGNFSIKGVLSEDGINAAVLPAACDNPQLLVRAFNTTTGVVGAWFAAGIVGSDDD